MKKLLSIVVCAMLVSLQTLAQKYDYQWPFGDGHNIDNGFGISLLDFNNSQVTVSAFAETDPEMSNSGSFICDKNGALMLMTNNCEVYDRNFQVISGGDSLTPGNTFNTFCADFGDYPADQSSLFLPALDNDSVTYLLHKDSELSDPLQDVVSRHLYLSVIVRKADGSFYLKEKRLLLATNMVVNRLTACLHQDGVRWWTWVAGYNTNKFYKFLVGGSETVQGPFVQNIGPVLLNTQVGVGQTAFSPNGGMLGMNNKVFGALLYDFNPASGDFSNWKSYLYPNPTGETAEGLVFSPNSQLLYLTAGRDLYQMDLQDPDPAASTVQIAHLSLQDETGWPIGVGSMYLGPDCRVYVGPGSTTFYIHTIHQPNEKGLDCQFEINAIRAPTRLEFDLPNIPMYRFNGQCDGSIGWGIVGANEPEGIHDDIRVFPNPVIENAMIRLPASQEGSTLLVLDMFGRVLQRIECSEIQTEVSISTDGMPPGVYFLAPIGKQKSAVKFVKGIR